MNHLTRAFKVAVVLGIAWFVGLAVAVASAAPMFAAVSVPWLAGIMSGLVVLVVGWRNVVTSRSPGVGRRLAYAIGWSLVGWVAAIVAGNVLYGSANALVYLIAVGFGVAAYVVLLFRDRRRGWRNAA